jgi:hypothetical protein
MRLAVSLLLLAALACAATPAPGSAPAPARVDSAAVERRVEMGVSRTEVVDPRDLESDFTAFVPAVPAEEVGGDCMSVPTNPGVTFVLLSFPTRELAIRRVGFARDSTGHVESYSDIRGDLRDTGTRPRTSITINFEQGFATAVNVTAGVRTGMVSGPADAALNAATLGVPNRMIEMVRARCDAGAR